MRSIDLSKEHARELRSALAPFTAAARRSGGRRRLHRSTLRSGGPSTTELRTWAEENGYHVASRGRIAAEVEEAYAKAH